MVKLAKGTGRRAAAVTIGAVVGFIALVAIPVRRYRAKNIEASLPLINVSAVVPVIRVADLAPGEIGRATFHLVNNGPNTATIDGIKTSCGCTAASAAQNVLAPAATVPV
jgi:hypothetical protein